MARVRANEATAARWEAQAAERAWWQAYNRRIYLEQVRIAAAHARFVAAQRARARAAAARKQAARRSFLWLVVDNAEAIAADAGAAVVQPIPGLDAAADVGAAYLDRRAASGDLEYLSSDGDPDAADPSCSNSFAGSTAVLMADGTSKPIDEIRVGDTITDAQPVVLIGTKDEHHTVTAVHVIRDDQAYTDVTVNTGHGAATITGTAYHLYWDATTRSWTPADKLRIGDHLQSSNGALVTITALHDYATVIVTYNLTIEDLHTYYVLAGSVAVLVHNSDCDPIAQAIADHANREAHRPDGDGTHYVRGVDEKALANYVHGIINDNVPNVAVRYLRHGRVGYWDPDKEAVVIEDGDGGTVFTRIGGKGWFDNVLK